MKSPVKRTFQRFPQAPILPITMAACKTIGLLLLSNISILLSKTPLGWNYTRAALCHVGAVYFIFHAP
jgi:uncharacterized protein (DUF486 family)